MDRDILIAKKEELKVELEELMKLKHWTPEQEKRIHDIKKLKLKIKDLLTNNY